MEVLRKPHIQPRPRPRHMYVHVYTHKPNTDPSYVQSLSWTHTICSNQNGACSNQNNGLWPLRRNKEEDYLKKK